MKVRLKEGMQWLAGLVAAVALLLALPQVAFAIPEGELWVNGENIDECSNHKNKRAEQRH